MQKRRGGISKPSARPKGERSRSGAECKMRKNVKLSNKKAAKTPEKEPFFFFVKDQGEGSARVIVIVLKIIELILTSIFALCLGVFGSLVMSTEIKESRL